MESTGAEICQPCQRRAAEQSYSGRLSPSNRDIPFVDDCKMSAVHHRRNSCRQPHYLTRPRDWDRRTLALRQCAALVLFSSLIVGGSSFMPCRPLHKRCHQNNVVHFSSSTVQISTEPIRRMSTYPPGRTRKSRRNKVILAADDDVHAAIRNQQKEIERLYRVSAESDEAEESLELLGHDVKVSTTGKDIGIGGNGNATEPESLMRKRVQATLKRVPRITGNGTQSLIPVNRSSTMPGLSTSNDEQSAYRAGIRIIEERTGRKDVDTPEKQRKRRVVNGASLYKRSPIVPDSLVQFADEIHLEERISRQEEIELGEKTQEAIRLQTLYDVLVVKLDREPTNEEWCAASGKINMEAIKQAIEDGLEAKNKLVTSNLRMVQSVVNTYIRNGLSAQYNAGDMMQEGIMALIRAAEKFEPDRGWKFSTYAMYWVRSSVKRSQILQSRIITVPQRLNENHKRLCRLESESIAATGKKPTRKQLGEMVGMTEDQVDRCMLAMEQRCYSLDEVIQNKLKPGKDERRDTLIEVVEAKDADKEYEVAERAMLREDLVRTLHRYLTPKEAEVLLLRYGLAKRPSTLRDVASDRQVSIAELGNIFGMKPDQIRRMIDNSLKRLKGLGMDELLAFERDFL